MRRKRNRLGVFACLVLVCAWPQPVLAAQAGEASQEVAEAVGTAVVLLATGMGFLMIPGVGLAFAGLVRRKNVLATFQHSFCLLGLVTLIWTVVGFSLAFGPSRFGGILGGLDHAFLRGLAAWGANEPGGPGLLRAWTYLLPATLALALVSGGVVERMKFSAYLAFGALWSVIVFVPIIHGVWGGGWMAQRFQPLDHAGGLVVQVPAGVSAFCAAWVIGRRRGVGQEDRLPHNLTLTAMGTSLLWVGWVAFGIARSGGDLRVAVVAAVNLHLAAAGGLVSWSVVEWLHQGRVTMLGACTGAIAGLASASAAAASVDAAMALFIGLLVCPIGYAGVVRRGRSSVDDALDVSAIHGLCGAVGVVAPILLARSDLTGLGGRAIGGLLEGSSSLVVPQLVALAVVAGYAFAATFVILKGVDRLVGLRVSADDEDAGLDLSQHGGRGYILEAGEAFILRSRNALAVEDEEDERDEGRRGRSSGARGWR